MRAMMNWKWLVMAGLVALAVAPTVAQAGSGPSYCWNEARNQRGPNRCTNNNECDGARTCSSAGWCQGTARTPNPGPKGPTYCWDEARNRRGQNRCTNDRECDGARTCDPRGWCQGNAGHAGR